MFRRRRPLMRAAVVGGGAYVAGRSVARRSAGVEQQDTEQDERLDNLEPQAPAAPAREAPAAAPSMPDQLNQLTALHEQGALTDDEFAAAKARLPGG